MVIFNGTAYAYLYNLQGDIIGLLDSTGTKVVSYTYDAWGNPINKTGSMASTLGTVQPFRYRGYVYDEETELHYLRSRYYRFATCRFINADEYCDVAYNMQSKNIYVYCNNNSVILSDSDGQFPILAAALFVGASTLLSAAGSAFVAWVDGKSGEEIAQAALEGGATGFAASTIGVVSVATGLGPLAGFGLGAASGAVIDGFCQYHEQTETTGSFSWDNYDWERTAETAVTTGLSAAVPVIGNTFDDAAYVAGSVLLAGEATTLISVGVIIHHKIKEMDQVRFGKSMLTELN